MRIERWTLVSLAVLSISGCGVTIGARRVPADAAQKPTPSIISGSGVVYALPKTDFEVVQPVKVSTPTSGALQPIFESCRRSCDAGVSLADACKFDTNPKVKWSSPTIRTVSAPDYSRLYQVNAAADVFQSLDLKFDIGANGVLDRADATASNTTYEVLTSLATTAIKVAGTVAKFAIVSHMQKTQVPAAGNVPRTCYEVSTDVDKLTKDGSGTLTCGLLRDVRSCMTTFESDVESERAALNTLFDRAAAAGSKMDSKLLDSLAANRSARIDAAVTKRDAAAALYGLDEGKPKEATYQIVIPVSGPTEFNPETQDVELGTSITTGKVRVIGISDNAADLLPALTASVKDSKRIYRVATAVPPNINVGVGNEDALLGGGYRYRVPTPALTTLSVYADSSTTAPEFLPLVQYLSIAQYGPIAALPSDFKGKGGHVMVKLWPDSGGLQTVEIGAEPIPTSSVTGIADEAFTQFKARQDKAAAAAAAAAAADPELDKLTRQQKILSLQKEIKDLQDALNK